MADCKLDSKKFFEAVGNDQLIGSRCLMCGHMNLPQRCICSKCHSDQTEPLEFQGTGTLSAFTIIYVPATEMVNEGYNAKNPYCVGIVTLDEGPRISAQILGMDLSEPAKIKIGIPLKMTTVERGPEEKRRKFLAFEPI